MDSQIQIRRDTASNWSTNNPTLAAGEIGLETDTGLFKIGDGSTTWSSLGYKNDKLLDESGNVALDVGTDIDAKTFSITNQSTSYSDFNNLSEPTPGTGITDEGSKTFGQNVVLSGQTTLSSGVATVDTTLSATDATFMLALGIDDPNADCEVAGRVFWDDTAGTYKIKILEQNTSVGNPTVNYDVVRVR